MPVLFKLDDLNFLKTSPDSIEWIRRSVESMERFTATVSHHGAVS
jgi:hypothetical protein